MTCKQLRQERNFLEALSKALSLGLKAAQAEKARELLASLSVK
jgi:hypothetical protein